MASTAADIATSQAICKQGIQLIEDELQKIAAIRLQDNYDLRKVQSSVQKLDTSLSSLFTSMTEYLKWFEKPS